MSLINQVLKDIESRYVDGGNLDQSSGETPLAQAHLMQRDYQLKHLLSVALGTAVLSVFLSWWMMHHQWGVAQPEPAFVTQTVTTTQPFAAQASTAVVPGIASILGLNIVQRLDDVDLYFDVSALPLVKVELNEAHDGLTVELFKTQGIGQLKSMTVPGLGAFEVRGEPQGDNVIVHIKMPFQAKIAKIDPIEGKKPRIHVALLHIGALMKNQQTQNMTHNMRHAVGQGQPGIQSKPSLYAATALVAAPSGGAIVGDARAYEQAISMLQVGQSEDAVHLIGNHIARSIVDSRLIVTLVGLLVQKNRLREAMMVVQGAITLEPNKPVLIKTLAQLQFMQHQEQQALTTLTSLAPSMARHPDYYGLMASIYLKGGEVMLAGALYRRLVEYQPHNVNWWVGLGLSMQSLQEVNIAIESYQQALKLGIQDQSLHQFVVQQLNSLR
jgi:Flp pilus assembly protein TadD